MKQFRKIYSYVLIGISIFNIILYLLNQMGEISLINETTDTIVKLTIPILICFWPYWGKKWISKLILMLCRVLALLSIPCIMFTLAFSGEGTDVKYAYVYSPNYTHEVIIRGSVSGLHHFSQSIEVYEKVGKLFKKDLNTSIIVSEDEDGKFSKAIFRDGIVLMGQRKYDVGNGYAFEWLDENTLEISYISSNNQQHEEIKKKINLLQ